jgi:branched-chain amino acid transport system ATP-binding protein
VVFDRQSLIGKPAYEIAQSGMAIVPQGRRIFKSLTVRENLLLPTSALAGHRKSSDPNRKQWTLASVLEEFPQLAERMDNTGNALSGGEQQMLAIGRALMANPSLILMDEPSEGLSPKLVQKIEEIMRNLRSHGHAILLVEQNLALALSVADSIYVISSGQFVFHGTPEELSRNNEVLDSHVGVAGH